MMLYPHILALVALASCSEGLRPSDFGINPSAARNNLPPSMQQQQQQQQQNYQQQNYQQQPEQPTQEAFGAYPEFQAPRETVEERTEKWRRSQEELRDSQTAEQRASANDGEGRLKLMTSLSKGSMAIFFFILMWRAMHHFEMADECFSGNKRLMLVAPPVFLFVGHLVAFCFALMTNRMQNDHPTKKRAKAILNVHKLVELVLFIYNIVRMAIFPNPHVIKEIYVGRALSNFIYLGYCQLFTKVSWDSGKIVSYIAEIDAEADAAREPMFDDDDDMSYGASGDNADWRQQGYNNNNEGGQQQQPWQNNPTYEPPPSSS
eukprot:CAMPEP_0198291438 /NCGR_PEP_ID=MMETSP1449-20131203/8967_1 /TAXON_ID=420275 /ORGANISM="Attheya septentrionalis, Strain CCMP2084" /LENGTH=318 /DNA_ID=CAMNT_0043990075 /DNA_START=154 /DNA_END=1106 /DNA_ORIENTATION=+